VVGTDEFEGLARLEAKNRGLEGLPLAMVKHPLGGIKAEEVAHKAQTIVARVAQAVCDGQPATGNRESR